MQAPNPDFRSFVEWGFREAAFVNDVGIVLRDCGPGWVETELAIAPRHLQHTGVIHAGVQTTIADHTAGAAAMSLTPQGQYILTAEFKLSLLRAGKGERLWCRAEVVKPGRSLMFVESQVHAIEGDRKTLISKLTATMAVVDNRA